MMKFAKWCCWWLLALVLGLPSVGRATWYGENVGNGADVMMMDIRWPWWPSGTYYANWNSGFNPKPNNLSFYAGFTSTVPDGPGATPNADEKRAAAFRPGSVWTFWGSNEAGTPVRFVDVAPNLYIKNDYGGEGSSGTVGGEGWPFVKSQRWYTMMARVWQPLGKEPADHAWMGRWIKDHADGRWHLIGMARLPIAATSFHGNAGFIEPLTSEKAVRSLHRRLGYFRKDGVWQKSDTISIDKTQYVVVNTVAEGDHEYVAIEYAQRPDLLPQRLKGTTLSGEQKHFFTTKQPDAPTLDVPMVEQVRAESTGSQVLVQWEWAAKASPAFGYKIEVFANPQCTGAPVAVAEARNPSARMVLVDAVVAQPTVRVTFTDVFDQATVPQVLAVAPSAAATAAAEVGKTMPGLAYELYQKDDQRKVSYFYDPLDRPNESHAWLHLAELESGKLVRRGLARGFDLSVREVRTAGYALKFTGWLQVPTTGMYGFKTQIDGAYRIKLNGTEAFVRDEQWGTTERAFAKRLAAGLHALEVTVLVDHLPARNFGIDWEGPGFGRRSIPVESLLVEDVGAYPGLQVTGKSAGNGTGTVQVAVDARGHVIQKTKLFLGALQLAESGTAGLTYAGPLPRGKNAFWSRVIFDDGRTVDSPVVDLENAGPAVDTAWTVRNVSDAKALYGVWQQGAEAFQFFGNGMHTVTKRMKGDFTATCRVDAYNGSAGEPVNRRAWVGLTAREHGEKRDWEWGQDFHLVQTAAEGLRSSADFTDFGAGRICSYPLPKGHPWLRIVRRGNIWSAWSSADGAAWELGAYHFKKTNAEMDVGLFFSALPQEAQAHYHASVSSLKIEAGPLDTAVLPPSPAVTGTDGVRLTGVVVSRSDAQTVVVRSSGAGLWRTTDGGKGWTVINGALTGDDLAVRTVAIHPTQPETMLRGGNGGLWKTTDGGKQWVKLPFPGDFDGRGGSAICGEVVAFDLKNPEVVIAGSESKGCFKSTDGGATWTPMGLVGERITAVVIWPWERHYPAPARGRSHLCVTTCPDAWMPALGRGPVTTATTGKTSRGYVSNDNLQSLTMADERVDTGFYNVSFDKALQSTGEMRYATTHGIQAQVFSGNHMALYHAEKDLEWLRPFTAIHACAQGDEKFGRTITQALNPVKPGRVSKSERWSFEWSWLQTKGAIPPGGLIAVQGDERLGKQWWFVYTDGLYFSEDGGATLRKVLDAAGAVAK